MITVPGTLFIRSLNGVNGSFSVGRLVADIGTFTVKDPALDQYGPGKYVGVFDISRIFPSSYACHGHMVVEVRAKLAGMALSATGSLPESDSRPQDIVADPIEPELSPPAEDALTEPEAPPAGEPAPEPETQGAGGKPGDSEAEIETNDDARLFGPLWPLNATLKLDTTVDRKLLRQQRDRLKVIGYRFDAKTQTWFLDAGTWLMPV